MHKEIYGTTINFYDENKNELMKIDYSSDECIWYFYSSDPIIISEDSELFLPLKMLMKQEYEFDNKVDLPLKNYKDLNKILWHSDCYYNPDDEFSLKSVSKLNIEDNGAYFKIYCYKPLDEIINRPIKRHCIAFSPLGNGQYSKNLLTGSTFQDDFVMIIYQNLLKNNFVKKIRNL